jgi:predicted metal-dependent enzyme (double-stranded beta helix superfamily)
MTTQAVTGLSELVSCLDEAVQRRTTEEVVRSVKDSLCRLVAERHLELPPELTAPEGDRYARRLLHKSERHGYTAIVMTWDAGQATPLHDHAGMWCVDAVVEGEIEVTQYDLLEERDDRYRFAPARTIRAGFGKAGALIPPFEYHTIANRSPGGKAVTLHVYAGEMTSCTIFMPADDGWYRREERQLGYCE